MNSQYTLISIRNFFQLFFLYKDVEAELKF